MSFPYFPKKLKKAKEEIILLHKNANEPIEVSDNENLRKLIMSLVKLEKYQIRSRAYALSNKEAEAVAGYIPHNYYGVNMKNLFEIFAIRTSGVLCQILYNQWQESYQNEVCNAFMRDILKYDENLISLILKNNMDEKLFDSILSDKDVASRLCNELKKHYFPRGKKLEEKLFYFGIREDSKLFFDCKFLFYLYCDKEDYLSIEKSKLLNLIKQYNRRGQNIIKRFLSNFLEKLSLRDLIGFKDLADYLKTIVGDNVSAKEKFNTFFKGFQPALVQKYIDWINLFKVEEYFGFDERSRFWKQYHFKSVRKYNYSNSVVMEFDTYYAVEFLGQGMGPLYIYPRDYFERYIINRFRNNDNSHMRHLLLYDKNWFYRKEHRGYWESDVQSMLIRNRITNRINI